MPCELFKPPPQTKPFGPNEQLPQDAHSASEAYLQECLTTHAPLGTFQRGTLDGVAVCFHFEHHLTCNGSPGCCPAVTLLHDLSNGTALDSGVTAPTIDWALVSVTAAAAAGTVALFWLALKHAGKARKR